MASDDKKKALDAAIAKLEKDFGKGLSLIHIYRAGSSPGHVYGKLPVWIWKRWH